ncbi:hypothetical protein F443_10689 [Phytophthora nicotianae P1569]|uniref:Uncharacterized protein n=1 Tax=Phytophthora nicotianae P1569 TaxID=1317065 RepID=V9F1G7_PHYNI|nr:hypothetical protein F443_10689 [Phytophthora nicotianae P1569]
MRKYPELPGQRTALVEAKVAFLSVFLHRESIGSRCKRERKEAETTSSR